MKNTKKLIALTLVILMMALTLAGCGGGANVPDVGDIIEFGGYDWRVLDVQDGKTLIITDRVIEKRVYHSEHIDVTWATSDMRAYLNGDFYNSFSEADRARIADTNVTNSDNQWFGTAGGDNTTDKIFLLSLSEVVQYFGDADQLAKPESEREYYAGFHGSHANSRIAYNASGAASWWWLRSPGAFAILAALVRDDGLVTVVGLGVADDNYGCVRPALWLTLE